MKTAFVMSPATAPLTGSHFAWLTTGTSPAASLSPFLSTPDAMVRIFHFDEGGTEASTLRGWRRRMEETLREGPWDGVFCAAPTDPDRRRRALALALLECVQSLRVGEAALQAIWNAPIVFLSAPADAEFPADPGGATTWQEIQTTPLPDFFPDGDPLWARSGGLPIGVVVRTRDRPVRLREALASLEHGFLRPAQVVVVNDGSDDLDGLAREFPGLTIEAVSSAGRGRGAAANAGLDALATEWAAFLDDDDRVYRHHYSSLSELLVEEGGPAAYSDALSVLYRQGGNGGTPVVKTRLLAYSRDFDPDLLLYDNYIPLHTLVFRLDLARASGPVREDLPVFEDWEFLVRLSRRGVFRHLRRITCEYRHFPDSQTLGEDPSGKASFSAGRRRVLALTRQYRSPAVEERFVKALVDDAARLVREKAVQAGELASLKSREVEFDRRRGDLHREIGRLDAECRRLTAEQERLRGIAAEAEALRSVVAEQDRHLKEVHAEIHRLNGLLNSIYGSKTWKLHQMVETLRRKWR